MLRTNSGKGVSTFVTVALAFATVGCATAVNADTLVNYSWTGASGYSALGSFSYNPATTPQSFLERPGAVGPTKYLTSFSVSFFNPQHSLLESGSSIVSSVTTDRFFALNYNTQTMAISTLDADIGGSNYQYFLTNLRTPSGQVVPAGVTTFNLFYRPGGTPFIDGASSVQVTSVSQIPEPSTATVLLGLAGLGGLVWMRRSRASA